MTVLALTGGIGGAKLALGLSRVLTTDEVVFLVNTGDDFEFHGLQISPDVDTLTYTLAGVVDTKKGWGRADESWNFASTIADYGGETWFQLGDKDIALHVLRTQMLKAGDSLTAVTSRVAKSLSVGHRILPMSDDPVRTMLNTNEGRLTFQDYFVRKKCAPVVTEIDYEGAASATLNPALDLENVSKVIICPSNPYLSVGPMLALPQLAEFLRRATIPVVAVSPIIQGSAIKGPTAKMMIELGIESSTENVAKHYREYINGFVVDRQDIEKVPFVEKLGIRVCSEQTIMRSLKDRIDLAHSVLKFADSLGTV